MKQYFQFFVIGFLIFVAQFAIAQNRRISNSYDTVISNAVSSGFDQGKQRERDRNKANADARLQEARDAAAAKRQADAFDLQLRNELELRKADREAAKQERAAIQQEQANKEKTEGITARSKQWDKLRQEYLNYLTVLRTQAGNDANNPDVTEETKISANNAMQRLYKLQISVYAIPVHFEDPVLFQKDIENLQLPELGYTAEFVKHTKKSKTQKKR